MSATATPTLSFGEIYGELAARHETGGFVISAARPVVPPEEIPLHTHPEGAFTFILSGFQISTARRAVDGGFGPGSLIYNPPGTTHRDRMRSTSEGRCLSISIPYDASGACALPTDPTAVDGHEARGLVRAIARECAAWDAGSAFLTEGLCFELVDTVANPGSKLRGKSIPRWLTRAQELLTERCTDALTVGDVAREVGVHPAHLARSFSRFFRRSPGEHVRRSRVARAEALLRETDLPLAEIALSCGFADQSHFTHVFRRYKGLPPAAFRMMGAWQSGASGRARSCS
ncbi:MAG TPA: AraC family transcriptional regulator [Candidatus Polarisedimenticolaceae bacterium]|nr:AraC family transcriptional regulator [Candidatus Polarisedimenticolaceae bacterium]